ncbi:MAG: hypothetical protein M0Q51_00725 [Bacteroidales bacterium]|nr:hypothetical protein [Bacteroidales bacterium]
MKKPILFLLVVLSACTNLFQSEPEDRIVARANDKYLRISELADRIPDGLSERDSITLAENYITKWIQQEILTQKAKESLKSDEQDFSKQLDEYRNSLLLFTLEQKLVSQYLDTNVTPEQIEAYYSENRSQFELKGNIVKFDFVKINKRSRHLREFRKLLKSPESGNVLELAGYAEKNATDYWFAREWVSMSDLLDEMPLEVDNQALFLRRTNYAEAEDSVYIYLVRINDFKTADSISPIEFEREKIRNIILNGRKINLIEMKRQEFIDQAFKDDKAKIY